MLVDSGSPGESIDMIDRIRVNEFKIQSQMDQISSLERMLSSKQEQKQ